MKGFSPRNLVYMQTLAGAYSEEFTQQAVARIPWGHNCVILDKVTQPAERAWYVQAVVEHGWSRNVLAHQIETNLTRGRERPSPTSRAPCLLRSPTLRSRC